MYMEHHIPHRYACHKQVTVFQIQLVIYESFWLRESKPSPAHFQLETLLSKFHVHIKKLCAVLACIALG